MRTLMLVVCACVLAVPATASAAGRDCGWIGSGLDRLHVRVVSGPVGCAEARKVLRTVGASGRVGKWRCDGGAGGIGCTKSRPRARITAYTS